MRKTKTGTVRQMNGQGRKADKKKCRPSFTILEIEYHHSRNRLNK
nr:MAG TPA: hypothetical protein [Inoviridae sp.]